MAKKSPERKTIPEKVSARPKPSARKAVEQVLKMNPQEQHLVFEAFGTRSFGEAMRDHEGNFMMFISTAADFQHDFGEERFAQMLIEAATASRENAVFFVESAADLKELIEDRAALKKAVAAAQSFLRMA